MRQSVFRKVLRHKLGLIGFIIIAFFSVIAFFGYLITPDQTPDANDIQLPLAGEKPGAEIKFIRIYDGTEIKSSFLKTMLSGKQDNFKAIPVKGNPVSINGDSLKIQLYTGSEDTTHLYGVFYTGATPKEKPQFETRKYYLGADAPFGRDVLSRLMIGSRISLAVGLVAVVISLLIGTVLGLFAGYYRGWADRIIMWLINVIWSLPTFLLVVAISFALGKGFWQIFVAVGLSSWVEVARMVRGQVFSVREKEYIQAARVLGFSNMRIMFRHILPNIKGPLIVVATANFGSAILLEAGLSFLGLGVEPPAPSWGMMIKEYFGFIVLDSAYLAIIPGIAIMVLVMAFNFLGIALRDALDVNISE
ncbi:MAG: ABC transporter permease [Bacteroidia bacterium]|nr:ABC transporter permease [Bacteroidia bacterium]